MVGWLFLWSDGTGAPSGLVSNRRLLRNTKVVEKYEQHYSLELCFSIEKQAETVLSGGVFRIGARGSGQVGTLLNGCNDFDETLME